MLTFQDFATPAMLASRCADVLNLKDGFHFHNSHDYLLPPIYP